MNLNKAVANDIISHYCETYKLSWSLLHLSLGVRDRLNCRHIKYPDPIEDLILGYINFNTRSLLLLPSKNSDYAIIETDHIYKFFIFIYLFGGVLDKCNNDNRKFLLDRFESICKANTDAKFLINNFRAFYHEIKTFYLLYFDGHILQSFPEKDGLSQGKSPADAIFRDVVAGYDFQVECKSISTTSGHPITSKTAELFFDLLVKDSIYKDLCPEDKDCCIELKFAKRLSSNSKADCWSAEDLLVNLKKGSDVELITHHKVRILEASEDKSKLSKTEQKLGKKNVKHQIILHSLAPNNWDDELQQKVAKAINKKNENGISLPTLCSIEIYGPSTISSQYDTFLISDKIQIKDHNTQQLVDYYKVPWDDIIFKALSKTNHALKNIVNHI